MARHIRRNYVPWMENDKWFFTMPGEDGPPEHPTNIPITVGPYETYKLCLASITKVLQVKQELHERRNSHGHQSNDPKTGTKPKRSSKSKRSKDDC